MSDGQGFIERLFYTPKTEIGKSVVLIEFLTLLWLAVVLGALVVVSS